MSPGIHRNILIAAALLGLQAPVYAIVGGATAVRDSGVGRHIVMILSTRGSFCTGTALTPDLVLTAGHCVAPAATYRVLPSGGTPPGIPVRSIAVHPRYKPGDYASRRVTADLALLKLEHPLPGNVVSARLAADRVVAAGDRLTVAGYGFTAPGTDAGAGVPRAATLIATGKPGNLQIRLRDPAVNGSSVGLGACTGDSGAPALVDHAGSLAVIGVVSWSTGPAGSEGCGGLTGVTPLTLYGGWIAQQARKMGSELPP